MTPAAIPRPKWEVADVIRQYGKAFLDKHGGHLTGTQKQALRDLARCRTAALGGHAEECLDCGVSRIAYNSCRNRHCPKCQTLRRLSRRESCHQPHVQSSESATMMAVFGLQLTSDPFLSEQPHFDQLRQGNVAK